MTDFRIAKDGYVRYYNLLEKYLSFKSVSTSSSYKKEINDTAQWLNTLFTNHNFSSQIFAGYGNPIVVASYKVNSSLPTCLIYGHYDVQPADIADGWTSDPFTLRSDGKKLYGRGVIDNKGQTLIHMVSIFDLIQQKKLSMNVVFLLEGDEESGGAQLNVFMHDNTAELHADFALISDGEMKDNLPTIEAGLRGGFNSTLTISTNNSDLHSGIYGGKAENAAQKLASTLSSLKNGNRILIPHFYDSVEGGYNTQQIPELLPALEITSISSGYLGEGYRNSIPATAQAQINVRTVCNQASFLTFELLKKHIQHQLHTTPFTITFDHAHEPIKLNMENNYVITARTVLQKSHGAKVQLHYSGGALPVVSHITSMLNMPVLLINLANEDCNMHGPEENFDVSLIKQGLIFSNIFFSTILEK